MSFFFSPVIFEASPTHSPSLSLPLLNKFLPSPRNFAGAEVSANSTVISFCCWIIPPSTVESNRPALTSVREGAEAPSRGAMLKQILNKIPRKSQKSYAIDSNAAAEAVELSENSNGFQCTTLGGGTFSNRFSVLKRVSSAVFPASLTIGAEDVEPSMSFKDVSSSQKQNLFISKLNLCCEVYDFTDPEKNYMEINCKHDMLIELAEFVSGGSMKFGEPAIAAMCRMCAVNLFRVFPSTYRSSSSGGEVEGDEPVFDPAWSHLQIVYDLLLRYIDSNHLDVKMAKKCVDHSFIVRLLDLFNSGDPRERDCLKTILHRIYGKFMVHRPFIRKAISNIILRFVFETERHNGISELLEIFGSIISGFALPLKEEHRIFLFRVLIPLHKPKPIGIYHHQLTYCVVQFIDKDPMLAGAVIKGLLKYWPVTNSQKELMFLSELEEVLEMTCLAEFQNVMIPLFYRIGRCLNSLHYQVAERAHLLWNNEHVLNLVAQNKQVVVPLVFPALERNCTCHWNQAVLNLSRNLKEVLSEMDEELVYSCQENLQEEYTTPNTAAEKRMARWEFLEAAAGLRPVATACTFTS